MIWQWTFVEYPRTKTGTREVKALLQDGWEPFSYAVHGQYDALHFKRRGEAE